MIRLASDVLGKADTSKGLDDVAADVVVVVVVVAIRPLRLRKEFRMASPTGPLFSG
jgi:hypothetical protein